MTPNPIKCEDCDQIITEKSFRKDNLIIVVTPSIDILGNYKEDCAVLCKSCTAAIRNFSSENGQRVTA